MREYIIKGMSCAACVSRIEKAVGRVDGVTSCAVSLLTNTMSVNNEADPTLIIKAVENAGYEASLISEGSNQQLAGETVRPNAAFLEDTETPRLKRRLIFSVIFLMILMYFSMGTMMFHFPLPGFLESNHLNVALIELCLCIIIMLINKNFFISGLKSLMSGSPNMDTLVALGSGVSFIYSLVIIFLMSDALSKGDHPRMMMLMDELYFESAAMILTLITVGKTLEAYSKGRTTDALKGLMKLSPETATLLKDGKELIVPIADVKVGDIFILRPGDKIPVDGVITKGLSSLDESSLTGESIPVDKTNDDEVFAGTLNVSGFLECRALKVGEDTTISAVIRLVREAAGTKAPIAKVADKVSAVFVPIVITLSLITFTVWMILGANISFALQKAVSVLVISCPCALGLATPVAIMVGNGKAAKCGIMFKTSASLEETGRADYVLLDKTGTITKGEPEVTDIIPMGGFSRDELLKFSFSIEAKSEHPLAKAVCAYALKEGITPEEVSDFKALTGNGVEADCNGMHLQAGSFKYMSGIINMPEDAESKIRELSSLGRTPLIFSVDGRLCGIISVADSIKEDSPKAISMLKALGLKVYMLTGDNKWAANAIAKEAGVDEVIAEVLPDGKAELVRSLKEKGKVIMVGDGINDSPALTLADIGIGIGRGSDIAIDAADIVLMKSSLMDVAAAIRLSRATLRNIHENLFWAFCYNIIGIPLAAGVFVRLGLSLNPMIGAACMSLSSFFVVTNALRLNLFDPYNGTKDKCPKRKQVNKPIDTKEDKTMIKTLTIEGMMCSHCDKTVKDALLNVPGVIDALANHEAGTAIVTMKEDVKDKDLIKAVEANDYKVTNIH